MRRKLVVVSPAGRHRVLAGGLRRALPSWIVTPIVAFDTTENLDADAVVFAASLSHSEADVVTALPPPTVVLAPDWPRARTLPGCRFEVVPEIFFKPRLAMLGREVRAQRHEMHCVHWEGRRAVGGPVVDASSWSSAALSLLTLWLHGGLEVIGVDLCREARLYAHLRTDEGAAVVLDFDGEQYNPRPENLRVGLGNRRLQWSLQDGREELVDLSGEGTEQAPAERVPVELIKARYLARMLDDHQACSAHRLVMDRARQLSGSLALRWPAEIADADRDRPVLLVNLPRFRTSDDVLALPPLGLARLQAFLRRAGIPCRVVDLESLSLGRRPGWLAPFADEARVEAWLSGTSDRLIDEATADLGRHLQAEEGIRVVGFSVTDTQGGVQASLAKALARWIKLQPGCEAKVVVGGDTEAIDARRLLQDSGPVDFVVNGAGELALASLVRRFDGPARCWDAVPGLCRPGGERLTRVSPARVRFDDRPPPDFAGVDLDLYRRGPSPALAAALAAIGNPTARAYHERIFYLPAYFVAGCSGRCVFCSWGTHLDINQPERAVEELIQLSEKHGTDCFYFLNTTLNISRPTLERFVEALLQQQRRLYWTDSARPCLIDHDLAAGLREAGCVMLSYGVESGSNAVLRRMRKGFTSEHAAAALQAAHQAGIINRVNLIAGFFHETDDDIHRTNSFLADNREAIDLIGCFQGFYLFPETRIDEASLGVVLRSELDTLPLGQVTATYDEVGGLAWPDKKQQIDRSFKAIRSCLASLSIPLCDKIDEHDLFHIARLFPDKQTRIRLLLASMGAMSHRVDPPQCLASIHPSPQ